MDIAHFFPFWPPYGGFCHGPRRRGQQEKVGVPEDAPFSESETQYVFETYHEMMGPLEDMSEVLIQFGYVTLFVVSFSIAPVSTESRALWCAKRKHPAV